MNDFVIYSFDAIMILYYMPHIFFLYKEYFPSPDSFEFPLKNRPYIDWNLRKSWEQIEKKRERTTSKRLQNWMKTESLQQTESIEVYKRWYCIQLHRSEAVLKLIRYFRTFFPISTDRCMHFALGSWWN